jgi:predicted dehydrogenase
VGLVGCGHISSVYLETFSRLPEVQVTAVADLLPERAHTAATAAPGAAVLPVADLLHSPAVDLVLNLTIPAAHAQVASAAIVAGKHVYGEKPLAGTTAEAAAVVSAAQRAGVRLGCAPDTVLGTGIQTARHAIDAGRIGRPVAATAFMTTPGHERWHHDPEFYYRPGGGPLLDMGPYYLTALIHLLGPVRRVTGMAANLRPERLVGDGPRAGTPFTSTVETHVAGVIEHTGGAVTTLMMSFDVWAAELPPIEVHGTAGSVSVPDPNYFDGAVRIFTRAESTWSHLPPAAGYVGAERGFGVADLAAALHAGTPHRAGAELALHVLDAMETLLRAAREGIALEVGTTCERPPAVPALIG